MILSRRFASELLKGKGQKTQTVAPEDVASPSPDPRHVFEAEERGVHPQVGAAFPDAANIARTNP